ncbi:HYD1 signature containing ADP-ribosyltransferase family protein [Streptomyces lasalocidi]
MLSALDKFINQIEQLNPGWAMANLPHDVGNGMAPGSGGPPTYVQPRNVVAHTVHAHTNTDAYRAGEATTVLLEFAASGGDDAPEAAVSALADARDTQDGLAAAAEVKNVVSETTEEATATAATPSRPDTGASGTGEGGCSFSPSTRVLLAHGKTKTIGAVKPGDKVEAGDPTTGKHRGPRTVQHVWINHDHDLLDVTIRTKDGHTATLHTTANHPFWDDTTHSWVPAGKLHHGDALNTAANGHTYVVFTRATPGAAKRWNLTVQQLHTYYVVAGGVPVLVHNSCGPDGEATTPAPRTLYHYTTEDNVSKIVEGQEMYPSLKANNPKDARYGDGQYFTDIAPGTKTQGQLSAAFLRVPWAGQKFTHYIEIDVTGLDVVEGRPGVFVVPNSGNLDLTGRIVSYGAN